MTAEEVYSIKQAMLAAEAAHMDDPADPDKLAAYRDAYEAYKQAREAREKARAQ